MIGRPENAEAASYYFTYINQVTGVDPTSAIEGQLEEFQSLFAAISEEKSLYRYAPEKWSIRQVLNHCTDTERAFAFRALWFARGFWRSGGWRFLGCPCRRVPLGDRQSTRSPRSTFSGVSPRRAA